MTESEKREGTPQPLQPLFNLFASTSNSTANAQTASPSGNVLPSTPLANGSDASSSGLGASTKDTSNPLLQLFSKTIKPASAPTPILKNPGLLLSTSSSSSSAPSEKSTLKKSASTSGKGALPQQQQQQQQSQQETALGKRKNSTVPSKDAPAKKRKINTAADVEDAGSHQKSAPETESLEIEKNVEQEESKMLANETSPPHMDEDSEEIGSDAEEDFEGSESDEIQEDLDDNEADEDDQNVDSSTLSSNVSTAASFLNTPNAPQIRDPTPEQAAKICPRFNSLQGCKNKQCPREHTIILSKKKEGLIRNISKMLLKRESQSLSEPKSFWDAQEKKSAGPSSYPKFQDHPMIHPKSKKALKVLFKYSHMTKVQAQTILPSYIENHLEKDYMVKAKTGSGKTLAFLIPVVEILLRTKAEMKGSVYDIINQMKQITCVILSPTRELVIQTEKEAQKLLAFHPNLTCKAIIGGTKNLQSERSNFENHLVPDILITTPGRFHDHLLNTNGFAKHLKLLQVLVMDEADQLLDQGFKDALLEILQFLPNRTRRQTLMFSATISQAVKSIAKQALKPKFDFIDCVDEKDVDTNETLTQQYMPISMSNMLSTLYSLLEYHVANTSKYKVIVFFPTANQAEFFSLLFNNLQITNHAMHSKKEQSYRRRISDLFHNESNLIMFSSDVSARGVDYPNVSLIVQVNLPSSMEQYVHRIGRTARAGKSGVGIILLCPFEKFFWKELKAKYGKEIQELTTLEIPLARKKALDQKIDKALLSLNQKGDTLSSKAYVSFLGFYRQFMRRLQWNNETLVETGNNYASYCLGLDSPRIPLRAAVNLKLEGVRGLHIRDESGTSGEKTS